MERGFQHGNLTQVAPQQSRLPYVQHLEPETLIKPGISLEAASSVGGRACSGSWVFQFLVFEV